MFCEYKAYPRSRFLFAYLLFDDRHPRDFVREDCIFKNFQGNTITLALLGPMLPTIDSTLSALRSLSIGPTSLEHSVSFPPPPRQISVFSLCSCFFRCVLWFFRYIFDEFPSFFSRDPTNDPTLSALLGFPLSTPQTYESPRLCFPFLPSFRSLL